MHSNLSLTIILVFIGWALFLIFLPDKKKIKKNDEMPGELDAHLTTENVRKRISAHERLTLIIMPILGYVILIALKKEASIFASQYLISIIVLTAICITFYFYSKNKKQEASPLMLLLSQFFLLTGIALFVFQIIHLSLFMLVGILLIILPFVTPAYFLFDAAVLFVKEYLANLQFTKEMVLEQKIESPFLKWLCSIYYRKFGWIWQILTLPIFITVVQFLFIILSQKPDSFVRAFIESGDGILSQGPPLFNRQSSEYVCTIAAHGSEKLVKPKYRGRRLGHEIPVNRQLQICNAFEEWLSEKYPKVHRPLRDLYDSLQISIEKWKHVRLVANALYILIKPLEITFLIFLYLIEKNPEHRIGRQYLPKEIYLKND